MVSGHLPRAQAIKEIKRSTLLRPEVGKPISLEVNRGGFPYRAKQWFLSRKALFSSLAQCSPALDIREGPG